MSDLKKNINLPLLYEVRKDVFVKLRNAECGERCFSLMHHMDLLTRIAREEGLLALEGAVKEIPSEIGFYQDIQSAVFYICDGIQGEDVIEILSACYWIKNLQGEDALLYFMIILSVIRIQDCTPPHLLESLLMSCLPDGAAEKYTEYKKQYQAERQEETPLEHLLNSEPDIGEGGILVVKRLLEEKIERAGVRALKGVICEAKDNCLEISLKGLSVHARKRLFSVISDYKAEEYANNCYYMGPVRQIDIMASMSELIALFENRGLV